MNYSTVCSGIEAPSVGWEDLGWTPQWFSEIEKFPSAVLKHHYPNVPNLGDMTKLSENETYVQSTINLLAGGTPCQSFSLAGLRGGMADERGNLALEFCRILIAKRPQWFVWENVPGVFSSFSDEAETKVYAGDGLGAYDISQTADFATLLTAFRECGYSCAWRVLDSQYFGVPQRRRRVFVVGYLGDDWRPPFAVLFERDSLRRDLTPSRKKGKEVAGTLTNRAGGGGFPGTDEALNGYVQPYNVTFCDSNGKRKDRPEGGLYVNETETANIVTTGGVADTLIAGPIDASTGRSRGAGINPGLLTVSHVETASTLDANYQHNQGASGQDLNHNHSHLVLGFDSNQLGQPTDRSTLTDIQPPLNTKQGQSVVIGFSSKDSGNDAAEDISPTLRAMNNVDSNSNGGGQIAIAQGYTIHGTDGTVNIATETDVHSALRAREPGRIENSTTTVVVDSTQVTNKDNGSNPQENDPCHPLTKNAHAPLLVRPQVRRLTPLECERLQGFPDNYTKIPGASDSARYQAIGNSMTTHVMAWIGSRIDKVDKLLKSIQK